MAVEEISCPKCKTTKYRDPSLKLMVNVCGHGICENCVKLLFIKGSGQCPHDNCDKILRKTDYRYQIFENAYVEKEVDIRKKLMKIFNKKEEVDFDDPPDGTDDGKTPLRRYNDYLEMVETYIYNLANGIDVEATNKKIADYKKENEETIKKNRNKKSRDEIEIEDIIEQEKELEQFRKNQYNLLMEKEQLAKVKKHQQEKLIDDLMCSTGNAAEILETHTELSKKRIQAVQERINKDEDEKRQLLEQQLSSIRSHPGGTLATGKFSSGITMSKSSGQTIKSNEPNEILDIYKPETIVVDSNGPQCPSEDILPSEGYLNHVRPSDEPELAGGFVPIYPCLRALQEAFCDLFYLPGDNGDHAE